MGNNISVTTDIKTLTSTAYKVNGLSAVQGIVQAQGGDVRCSTDGQDPVALTTGLLLRQDSALILNHRQIRTFKFTLDDTGASGVTLREEYDFGT